MYQSNLIIHFDRVYSVFIYNYLYTIYIYLSNSLQYILLVNFVTLSKLYSFKIVVFVIDYLTVLIGEENHYLVE